MREGAPTDSPKMGGRVWNNSSSYSGRTYKRQLLIFSGEILITKKIPLTTIPRLFCSYAKASAVRGKASLSRTCIREVDDMRYEIADRLVVGLAAVKTHGVNICMTLIFTP